MNSPHLALEFHTSLSEDWGVVLKLVARNPVGKSVDGDGASQGLLVPK